MYDDVTYVCDDVTYVCDDVIAMVSSMLFSSCVVCPAGQRTKKRVNHQGFRV